MVNLVGGHGRKKYEIKDSDLPINISSIVSEFILNEEKTL